MILIKLKGENRRRWWWSNFEKTIGGGGRMRTVDGDGGRIFSGGAIYI
jgi:hypothetical protein